MSVDATSGQDSFNPYGYGPDHVFTEPIKIGDLTIEASTLNELRGGAMHNQSGASDATPES